MNSDFPEMEEILHIYIYIGWDKSLNDEIILNVFEREI
jgi:hypothetical protein